MYTVQVNALGYANNVSRLIMNVAGSPLCASPVQGIQNIAVILSSPTSFLRSNLLTLTGITMFSCAYNYTNKKTWSLVEVDPTTGAEVGNQFDLNSPGFSGSDSAILVVYPNMLSYTTFKLTYSTLVTYQVNGGTQTTQAQAIGYIRIVQPGLNIFAVPNAILVQTFDANQAIMLNPGANTVDLGSFVNPSSLRYLFYCQIVPASQSPSSFFTNSYAISQLTSNVYQVTNPVKGRCFTSII